MADIPIDRIPLYTVILPLLGIAVWLGVGKVGLETLALVVAAVLLGNVISAVHHAEVIAIRVGEPFGTLVLALAVTVIEAGLIISIMLGGKPNPALLRDSVHAVVMLVLHGLAGLSIVVGAFRRRETEFRIEGANALLSVLIPMAVLVLVLPNYLVSVAGPFYSPLQLAFVSAACTHELSRPGPVVPPGPRPDNNARGIGRTYYQGTGPAAEWNSPVGPSSGSVASRTIAATEPSSSTFIKPR